MSLPRSRAAAAVISVAALVLTTLGSGPVAQAHDGTPGPTDAQSDTQSDAEHAAEDLAGVPMTKIEKDAKAKADQIQKQTGTRPGRRSPAAQRKAATVAAEADPAVAGLWGSVINTPVVPVMSAVLPNGKVLMWDSVGDDAAEHYPNHSFTRAAVWDPVHNTSKRVDVKGYNIFCAGYTQLSDGTVLVAGGNRDQALHGLRTTFLFDWRTETWRRGPDMAAERWYPSVMALPNQEALILGGGPATPEVYQTNKWMRLLTGIFAPPNRLYPLLTVRPDGNVDLVGPGPQILTLKTSGAGQQLHATPRDVINRDYASYATYKPGVTLVSGGGIIDEGGQSHVPTKTAKIVTSTGTGAPTVTDAASMAFARRQHNLTILADGNVLATGGESSAAKNSGVDLTHAVYSAELYNTSTNSWTTLSDAARVRQYHSTALLLPDGRVMNGGGGICAECQNVGYLEKNIQYFSPPYLYRNGQPAARPAISAPPSSSGYNASFSVTTGSSIQKVGLVKLGAPTHGDDQGQRYIPLTYQHVGTKLTIKTPANVNLAPPGYYMLFVTNSVGTPSVAKFVKLTATAPASPTAVHQTFSGPGARCLDLDHGQTTAGAIIQVWDCNGSGPQRWNHRADGTIQSQAVTAMCIDVAYGSTQPGVRLRTDPCSSTDTAQKWSVYSNGTIHSRKNPNVCWSAPGKATAERVVLAACNSSASTQKWRF